jgi:dynein heavy chain
LHVLFITIIIGEWSHWLTKVEEYVYPDDSVPEFSSILVPNVDNIRTNFLIETVSKQNKVSDCCLIPSKRNY